MPRSPRRACQLARTDYGFVWVEPPVLNPYTRLAVTMSPARGVLRAAGYEVTDGDLPIQVTEICEVMAAQSGEV
jgi:hypothetical protein